MVKYTGPKVRIIRKLGLLPGFTQKIKKNKIKTPGEQGKVNFLQQKRTSLSEDYKIRFLEKQKLRFYYVITEKKLFSYYKIAKKVSNYTGQKLLELLESRLDSIVYRTGLAPTILSARQLISHGHFFINEKKIDIPSFLCKVGDLISIRNKENSKKLILENFQSNLILKKYVSLKLQKKELNNKLFSLSIPEYLFFDKENMTIKVISTIKRDNINLNVNELKVIEYYSR